MSIAGFPRPGDVKNKGKYNIGSKINYKKLNPSTKPLYEFMDSAPTTVLRFLNYDKYTDQFVAVRQPYSSSTVYIYVYDKYLNLKKTVSVTLAASTYNAEIAFYRNNKFFVCTDGGSQFGARMEIFSDDGLTRVTAITTAGGRICSIAKFPILYKGSNIQYFSTSDSLVYSFDFSLSNPTLVFTPPFSLTIASGGGYYHYIEDLEIHCFTDFSAAYFKAYNKNFSIIFDGGTSIMTSVRDTRFPFYHAESDAIYGMYGMSNGSYYWVYLLKINKSTYQTISSNPIIMQSGSTAPDNSYNGAGNAAGKYYSKSKKYYVYLNSPLQRLFAFKMNSDGTIKGFESGNKDQAYTLNPNNVEIINYSDYPEKNVLGIPNYFDEDIMMFINNNTVTAATNKAYHSDYTING
jgi:hypothetical protein